MAAEIAAAETPAEVSMKEVTSSVDNLNLQDNLGSVENLDLQDNLRRVENLSVQDTLRKNRIQVSNTKKPLFFYVNLAKRFMQQHGEVELSALGMAIATVVTVAEILKNSGLAVEKKVQTATVEMRDEARGRPIQKAKVEIVLTKSDKFEELMAVAAEEAEHGVVDDEHKV